VAGAYMQWGLIIIVVITGGCASQRGPDYAQQWAQSPVPDTLEGRRAECQRLRVAMADEQGRANVAMASSSGNPMLAAAVQNKLRQRLAYMEDRASQLNCQAAFSTVVTAPPARPPATNEHMQFDQCFQKCKSLTNRDDNQCFDACK
jgi:hypothetical protein